MRTAEKSFRVHVQGAEYAGVDVFPDGTLQFYQEDNPRDVYWTNLTVKEVLKGKDNTSMKEKLGACRT